MPYYILYKEEKILFKIVLIAICQDIFGILALHEKLDLTYKQSVDYSKLKLSGLTKFLGDLYNNDVINSKILYSCYQILYSCLLDGGENEYYESMSELMKTSIKRLKNDDVKIHIDITKQLNDMVKTFAFPKMMCKFKIEDIVKVE